MRRKTDLDALRATLAASAYRITKPRMAIVAELASTRKYVTAAGLHDRLGRSRAKIGLATVYRTLDALRAVGAASTRREPGGETAYLFCPVAHHHHAVCTKCGTVEDVPCRSVARFERALHSDLRFRLTKHQLEFYGTCARCS
jgi:Fur family ferric uptake transcriptional regulator